MITSLILIKCLECFMCQKKKIGLLFVAAPLFFVSWASAESSTSTSPSDFWLPHSGRVLASGAAASDVRTIGGDAMLPVYGNHDRFLFADLMGDYGSDDTWLVSPGAGYRQIVDNQIIGGYFFGDYERTSMGANFWVLSPGVEWMNTHWDAHVNGYFPTETEKQAGDSVFLSTQGDSSQVLFETGTHNQYDQLVTPYAVIGNGVDAEIGYSFSELNGLRSRVYLGGYYYAPPSSDSVENIAGVTAGFEQPISKNLKVSLFNSYDQVSSYTVGVSLTATFGQDSTVFSNNIQDRLLDPVERHVGIIDTGAGTYDQQRLDDNGMALQYDNVYFIEPSTLPGSMYESPEIENTESTDIGTYGDAAPLTQETLDTINEQSPDGARIYIQGGSDANYYVNSSTADQSTDLAPNNELGLYVYDGQDFYGTSPDYTTAASSDEQPIIYVDGANNYNGFIVTESGENTFSDLTITEYTTSNTSGYPNTISGIVAYNETDDDLTLNIINTHITGMDSYGVYAVNDNGGTFTINTDNSAFNDNGVLNEGGSVAQNGAGMIALNNSGTMIINAINSQFNDNGVANADGSSLNGFASGLVLLNDNGGSLTLNTTSSQFNNNGVVNADNGLVSSVASGVLAINNEGSLTINAINSQFNGNGSVTGDNSSSDSAGILAENFNGSLNINAESSQFNDNGVVTGNNSSIDGNAAGIDAQNNQTGTLTINATNSQFNNNGVASGSGSKVDGHAAGLYVVNESSGTSLVTATNSMFNGNGIGTITQGFGSGIYLDNAGSSTGTMSILSLNGSSFDNNGQYGIYAEGSANSQTSVVLTGTSFSGNGTDNTNEGSSINVNWGD